MAYGDGHQDQVTKDIAEILRKTQVNAKAREKALARSNFNAGLHTAQMLVHARWTQTIDDEQRVLLEEIEKALELAKVLE